MVKALRRARNKEDDIPYIVSAWAKNNGLSLGQIQVDEKSNEITVIPKLLRILELKGCIVTLDAMGCQKKIAREIIKAQADYALSLKGNQSLAHDEVRAFFDVIFRKDDSRARTGFAAHNLAALRRLALNTLKTETSQPKLSMRSKRLMAAWNRNYLKKLLGVI